MYMSGEYYPLKKHHDYCFEECEMDNAEELCPTDRDLLLLRTNAKGEREAIAYYLRAASMTSGALCQLFMDTARDEMIHFRNSMTLLAKYDPMQASAFEEAGIDLPVDDLRKQQPCPQDRLEIIDLLTKSMADELEAINMYQKSYEAACHDDVKELFCANANDEKIHVAEFWRAMMAYTKENSVMS